MTRNDEAPSSRRAIAILKDAPETIELLLRWCAEKDAARVLSGGRDSIRSIVCRLGTLDRDHYLASVKRVAPSGAVPDGSDPPVADASGDGDFAECELAELLTRFRHVRAQSTEFLEKLRGEELERVSGIVTQWVNHDASALASLNAMCAELNRS